MLVDATNRMYRPGMMTPSKHVRWILTLALIVGGCSDEGAEAGTGGSAGAGGTAGSGGTSTGTGSATLTIGEETWDFDSFDCAFGYDATQTQVYTFSSSAVGEHSDGTRVQMQAEIEDASGQERYEGEGVIFTVYINDIENFSDPVVDWEARGEAPPAGPIVVRVNGERVTAEGVFDNLLTNPPDVEEVPGTLDATCSAKSIR